MKESTRTGWMVAQGIVMVALGLELLYVHATMTAWLSMVLGTVLALLLIMASLLFIVISDVICMAGTRAHRPTIVRRLLSLSAIAAAAGVVLILFVINIRGTCWLVAAYSLLLAIAKIDLAVRWQETTAVRVTLYTLSGIAVLFSCLLAGAAILAQDEAVLVFMLGAYSLFMGLQMLLTVHYVKRGLLTPPREQQAV
jgi:hypothetical protein